MKNFDSLHLHVISHTHWDREWYLPFEQFRLRLVDLIDRLQDIFRQYPEYVFELDAQTICLEDYLEIRPERRQALRRYIRRGNLRVGPWYVQNDFFLTSGEATVRNLLIGTRIAREFGRCGDVGYAPDQFGLIRQLPQILTGFGLDSCIFGRGFDRRTKNEFYWESPDGSRVLASFLSCWYNNLQRLSPDPERAARFAEHAVEKQDGDAATSHRLLMNGVDHLEAQEDLPEVLAHLPGFRQSTLREFIDGVRAEAGDRLEVVADEMRNSEFSFLLPGTLSARTPLKVANVRAQAALEWKLEPLSVMLALAADDWSLYETDMLRHAWKLLLQNHAHDSICGCSNSRVHADNMNRFARLTDLTDALTARLFRHFFDRLDRAGFDPGEYLLAVFNPAAHASDEEATAKLYFPLTESFDGFDLLDPEGRPVDFEVTGSRRRAFGNYPAINLPGKTPCREIDIRFPAEALPPFGYRVYTIRPNQRPLPAPPQECRMENEFLSFRVDDHGRVTLTDRDSGKTYHDMVTFRDEPDTGHTYNFFPAPDHCEIDLPAISRVEVAHRSDCVEVQYRFHLPRDYDFENRRRTEDKEENLLTVRYRLPRHARHLAIEFEVDNRSAAHRLRALFRLAESGDISRASVPFGFETRRRDGSFRGHPNSGVVAVGDLAIFNCGLHEYEHRTDDFVALTLLRCVGRVTNSDFPNQTPLVAESYEWDAPDANMIGVHRFSAAIRPGSATLTELENEYRKFIQPAITAFDAADARKFTSGRPCEQGSDLAEIFFRSLPPETETLPRSRSFPTIHGDAVISVCKRAETDDVAVLRIYNPDFGRTCRIESTDGCRYERCTLAEIPIGPVQFPLEMRPGEILTLRGFPGKGQ